MVPAGLPDPPIDLELIQIEGGVRIVWKDPLDTGGLDLEGSRIFRGTTVSELSLVAEVDDLVHSFEDRGLVNGTRYFYGVLSFNRIGEGGISEIPSIVPSTVPGAALNLSASIVNREVVLTWMPPLNDGGAAVIGYEMYRITDEGNSGPIAEMNSNVTTWTDHDVSEGHTYRYSIRALNQNGAGPMSGTVQITLEQDVPQDQNEDGGANVPLIIGILVIAAILAGSLVLFLAIRRNGSNRPMNGSPIIGPDGRGSDKGME
jgi:titin